MWTSWWLGWKEGEAPPGPHSWGQDSEDHLDGYNFVRHPQYAGFILIMLGFLVQWPTILTLAMFPILVWMYVRLAHREEREVRAEFGEIYARYAAATPAFIPRWRSGQRIGHGNTRFRTARPPGGACGCL
jgi:Phospholipid methyltransferase